MNGKITVLCFRLFAAITIFGNSIIIARLLGVKDSGYYYLGLNIISIVSVIANLGYGTLILKVTSGYLSQNPDYVRTIFLNAIKKIILSSILLVVFLNCSSDYICLFLDKKELITPLNILSVCVIFTALSNLLNSYLHGCGKLNTTVFLQNISTPLLFCSIMILYESINHEVSLFFSVVLYLISTFITFLIGLYQSYKLLPKLQLAIDEKSQDIKKSGNFSYLLINLSSIILMQGTVFLSSKYIPIDEFSLLNSAQRITNFISFFYVSILVIYTPQFSKLFHSGDVKSLIRISKNSTRLLIISGGGVVLFFIYFSKEIMSLYGAEFTRGWFYLVIFALGQAVNLMTCTSSSILAMCGLEKDLKNIFIVTIIICIPLSIIVPYYYSTLGAVIVMSLSLSLQNIISFLVVNRRLKFYAI